MNINTFLDDKYERVEFIICPVCGLQLIHNEEMRPSYCGVCLGLYKRAKTAIAELKKISEEPYMESVSDSALDRIIRNIHASEIRDKFIEERNFRKTLANSQ